MELALASVAYRARYFKQWREYVAKICSRVRELLNDENVAVIVFGSVVRGDLSIAESDIDVLIVSDKIPKESYERAKLSVGIREFLGDLFAPFELHFATWREYREWYSKFLDAWEKIC